MKKMMSVLLQVREVHVESNEIFLALRWISGMCFGIEFLLNHNIMVLDVGIVRIYVGIRERK